MSQESMEETHKKLSNMNYNNLKGGEEFQTMKTFDEDFLL